jgi:hypothetical protein
MAFIPAVPATISNLIEPDQDDDRSPLPAIHRIWASLLREGANVLEIAFWKNEIWRFLLAEMDNNGEFFSPMSCYCFGVVDASKDQLSARLYTEATAKKGGNNVASLLMHHLEHHGFVQQSTDKPFKELNFIMDNCGGKNKKRHVLKLMHFIVKRGVAKKANAIFLVRGHTNNACD